MHREYFTMYNHLLSILFCLQIFFLPNATIFTTSLLSIWHLLYPPVPCPLLCNMGGYLNFFYPTHYPAIIVIHCLLIVPTLYSAHYPAIRGRATLPFTPTWYSPLPCNMGAILIYSYPVPYPLPYLAVAIPAGLDGGPVPGLLLRVRPLPLHRHRGHLPVVGPALHCCRSTRIRACSGLVHVRLRNRTRGWGKFFEFKSSKQG